MSETKIVRFDVVIAEGCDALVSACAIADASKRKLALVAAAQALADHAAAYRADPKRKGEPISLDAIKAGERPCVFAVPVDSAGEEVKTYRPTAARLLALIEPKHIAQVQASALQALAKADATNEHVRKVLNGGAVASAVASAKRAKLTSLDAVLKAAGV